MGYVFGLAVGRAGSRVELGKRVSSEFCPQVLQAPKRPRLRHGLRGLGRHLAATSAPRPHRGTPQGPRAQIQAATEHRLHPARPISAASAGLHLRLAPALAAHNLRARTEPPSARPHDRARNRWHPSLLHLWSSTPHSACPHSGTGQILPRTRGKRNVPQCSPAYHGFPKLGHPLEAANPRPCVLHCAFALGSSCHRQSLSPNLLHLWPQRCGQLLRGPQQDPRPLCLPRCEPGVYKTRAPQFTMLARTSPPQESTPKPGPATYSVEEHRKPRGWSFGIKHSDYLAPVIPYHVED